MSAPIPAFPHSHIERDARGVYTLRIDDAKSLNILASPVTLGLTEAVRWIAAQADARALVLRGSGDKAFVGGANIYEMAELDPDGGRAFITRLRDLCEAVRAVPVPTIARLPGFCLGAGMELAAACDIAIALGVEKLKDPKFIEEIAQKYVLNEFEKALGANNPALREARRLEWNRPVKWPLFAGAALLLL